MVFNPRTKPPDPSDVPEAIDEARGEPRGASWDEVRDRILRAVTRR